MKQKAPETPIQNQAIVYGSSGVVTGFHFYHEQGEEEEEHGHGKADTIDSSVPHKHITADKALQVGDLGVEPIVTESRNLFQLLFHAWCQHNAGKCSTEEEEEGIDKSCHCRILAVGATSAQQTRGPAAQTGNLKGTDRNSKGIPLEDDTGALGNTERKTRAAFRDIHSRAAQIRR